jgi:uncharacterized damage-inducible protein DinB
MKMSFADDMAQLYARDLKRLIQEIEAFPNDQMLWQVLPGVTNSAGNLTLHLEGNLREYIGRLLGAVDYTRQRPLEFSSKDISGAELAARIAEVQELVPRVVAGLSEEQLDAAYPEQVNPWQRTTRLYLLHLYGHFSYHLGQIDYLRRILTNGKNVDFVSV